MKSIPIAAFVLLAAACSQERKPVGRESDGLDAWFETQFPANEPGGAVLIMQGNDTVLCKGYGLADIKSKTPITPRTLFNLGSISKTFVANAILMLNEQGKLSLSDNIYQYFPDFKNAAIAKKITIRHLLTHTSGLPDIRQIKKDSVFYLTAKDEENWHPIMQTEKLEFEPGAKYAYSNPAFNALALIVQQVSGMKWQAYVEKNIIRPSGMTTSTITDGPHPEQGVAHAYVKVGGQWREKDYGEEPTFAAAGNGGVWSNVLELERYEQAIKKGAWLKPATIADSRAIHQPLNWSQPQPAFIGWSWFIGSLGDSLATVGHTGTQGGFECNYVIVPQKNLRVFILTNTPRDIEKITADCLKKILKAPVKPPSS